MTNFHDLDEQKTRAYAKETQATITNNGLLWPAPPEAPENALFIPFADLGVDEYGMMYRCSVYPNRANVLLKQETNNG